MEVCMETQVVQVLDLQRDQKNIAAAATLLREGGLVVLPTETVYGIGANALDPMAVVKIFKAKGRPQDNPLIVHIARLEDITQLVTEFPPTAKALAERFWPGPLTIILRKSSLVPGAVSAGLDTVAVRMPSHPVARAIISQSGVPVAAPSANLSGSPSPTTAQHCIFDLSGQVDMIVDSGWCSVGVESTVVTLAGDVPRLLRPGAVTPEQLRQVLGEIEVDAAVAHKHDDSRPAASPGMKYKHYAPRARLVLVHGSLEKFTEYVHSNNTDGVFALVFDEDKTKLHMPCVSYGSQHSPQQQARRLFSALRELDVQDAAQVFARAPSTAGMGLAVYNRLLRAASFEEIYL